MFGFGVFLYDEPLDPSKLLTFAFIWTALVVYSLDALHQVRKGRVASKNADTVDRSASNVATNKA